jgi:hypothetical protein
MEKYHYTSEGCFLNARVTSATDSRWQVLVFLSATACESAAVPC